MKKIITEEQIKSVINTFYDLNAPVKLYEAVSKMLTGLPECPCESKKEETIDKKD